MERNTESYGMLRTLYTVRDEQWSSRGSAFFWVARKLCGPHQTFSHYGPQWDVPIIDGRSRGHKIFDHIHCYPLPIWEMVTILQNLLCFDQLMNTHCQLYI